MLRECGAGDPAVVGAPDVTLFLAAVGAAAPEVHAVDVLQGNPGTQVPDVVRGEVVGDRHTGARPERMQVGAR